jgi:NADPH-dependent ferric siderophore reductase
MSQHGRDVVEDREGLLAGRDHMQGMERIEMQVEALTRPVPSVARVTGRISPSDPQAWARPNVAVRLEVETPEGERPVSRVYTVRSFDAATGLVDIDFVIHADDSPAMRWLNGARPGTAVHIVGPRAHFIPDYESGRRIAIFADETAIPAVYAILSQWHAGARAVLYVETGDAAAFEELPRIEGVERHLLLRKPDDAAGTTGRLVEAARQVVADRNWTVWAAGERLEARAIRSHCIDQIGLARDDVRAFGYWRMGTSSSDIDRNRLDAYRKALAGQAEPGRFDDLDLAV